MKRCTMVLLLLGIAVSYAAPIATAQESDSTWIIVYDYMKSTSPDYLSVEEDLWKPIHAERKKAGELWDWAVDAVPQSFDGSYDYVTINVYRTWDSYENGWNNIADRVAAAHPNMTWDDLIARTEPSRSLVKSEIFEVANFTGEVGPTHSHVYMKVAPGGGQAYLEMEDEVYKPMHEAVIDSGKMRGWGIMSIVAPGGEDYPYNYVALNFHSSMAEMMGPGLTPEMFSAVHPDADWDEIGEMTLKTRKVARYEIWTNVMGLNDD